MPGPLRSHSCRTTARYRVCVSPFAFSPNDNVSAVIAHGELVPCAGYARARARCCALFKFVSRLSLAPPPPTFLFFFCCIEKLIRSSVSYYIHCSIRSMLTSSGVDRSSFGRIFSVFGAFCPYRSREPCAHSAYAQIFAIAHLSVCARSIRPARPFTSSAASHRRVCSSVGPRVSGPVSAVGVSAIESHRVLGDWPVCGVYVCTVSVQSVVGGSGNE